jgi:hypothetical protein
MFWFRFILLNVAVTTSGVAFAMTSLKPNVSSTFYQSFVEIRPLQNHGLLVGHRVCLYRPDQCLVLGSNFQCFSFSKCLIESVNEWKNALVAQ